MFFKTVIVTLLVATAYCCRVVQVKNSGSKSLTVSVTGQSDVTLLSGATALVNLDEDFSGSISAAAVGSETSVIRTKAELSLNSLQDSYAVSLVDGFNVKAKIIPIQGTGCSTAVCFADINAVCPLVNQAVDSLGAVVACSNSPVVFKTLCPKAVVTSADSLNVFTCQAQSYMVIFA